MKATYTVSLESNNDSTMGQEFTSKKEAKKRAIELKRNSDAKYYTGYTVNIQFNGDSIYNQPIRK